MAFLIGEKKMHPGIKIVKEKNNYEQVSIMKEKNNPTQFLSDLVANLQLLYLPLGCSHVFELF